MNPSPAPTTTVATGLLVAIATLPLREVFGDWRWTISVIGAALAASLFASVVETTRPRLSVPALTLVIAASAALWALFVSLRGVFWPAPASADAFRQLRDGVFHGWGALLDDRLPLADPQNAETFVAVVVFVAAAAAVHVAARRRTALAAIAGGAAVLGITTAAALPSGLPPTLYGGAAGVLALVAIATLTRASEQGWRSGRVLALLGVISVAAGLATIAAALSTAVDRSPVDPRTGRDIETVEIEVPDVLAEFGVRRDEDRTVLTIDSVASPSGLRLRLQVYETHDGERWVPAVDFDELASFPVPDELPPGDLISLSVRIEELDGPWLPVPDRLIDIDVDDVRWNEQVQTLITERQPETYEVTGTVVSRAEADGLEVARDGVPEILSRVPAGLPEEIRAAASDANGGSSDALAAIDAISARLRELGRDESTAPGHSLGRLRDDLTFGEPTGAEQIASLHALMLRSIGIPSRVVVGFVANGPRVESADLHVWVEAPFVDLGWVAFDPVPAVSEGAADDGDDPSTPTTTLPEDTALRARALPRELGPGEDPGETEIIPDDPFARDEALRLATAVLAGLVFVMITVRMVRRSLRRGNRGRADTRVLGAWAELVDRLRELGAPIAATTTTGDVVYMAHEIDETLGGYTEVVAGHAAIVLHGPHDPHPKDAEDAWDHLRLAEARITEVRGRRVVPRRYLDPRVLRYRAPIPPRNRAGRRRSPVSSPSRGR